MTAGTAATAAGSPAALPTPAELVAAGARFGEISVEAGDVFDPNLPGERQLIFRWANALHIETPARVVRRQLLFAEGDLYSASALAESARALRAQRFLAAASVEPVAYRDGRVIVEVRTRDTWSLKPGLSFNRGGGVNDYKIEIEEANFLGLGKELAVERVVNVDRTSNLLSYNDPNIFGSRFRAKLVYADSTDGEALRLLFERPFFALTTRRAGGIDLADQRLVTARYELGEVRDSFEEATRWGELWVGLSRGLRNSETHRLRLGVTYDEAQFTPLPAATPTALPPDRKLVYPWLGWSWIQDRFVIEHDFDRIHRPEDLAVGWQGSARIGFASESFGSDRDALVYDSALDRAFRPTERQIVTGSAALGGRLEPGGKGPILLALGLRYLWRDFEHQALYIGAGVDLAEDLDAERQLLIGGDSGLRGYPLRYQEGDRRVLLTIEQRWYGEREFFHLFRLGAVVFCDVGRAWFDGDANPPAGLGWLRDAGAGLRVASTRTSHANVVRLDLAFPLDGDPSIEKIQYLVSTSERF
ncbi:MAG: hypothetical protein KBF21_02795 [Thermoanaerobaculia bacterium]|nr:hypothetical protein [Thermoanaerobaculia bacterium]